MFFTRKKTYWEQNGKWVISAVVIAACSYGAIQYYQHLKTETTIKASLLYDQMVLSATAEDDKSSEKTAGINAAKEIVTQYKETPYAPIAALFLAKISQENKDIVEARRYLELAIKENSKGPAKPIATVRLAKLLAQEKKYREALDLLEAVNSEAYKSLFIETKGDIYWMEGQRDKAKTAYQTALKLSPKGIPTSRLDIKLAELGIEGGV